jgi:hypothetical protein
MSKGSRSFCFVEALSRKACAEERPDPSQEKEIGEQIQEHDGDAEQEADLLSPHRQAHRGEKGGNQGQQEEDEDEESVRIVPWENGFRQAEVKLKACLSGQKEDPPRHRDAESDVDGSRATGDT